jgi:hypothetical protein
MSIVEGLGANGKHFFLFCWIFSAHGAFVVQLLSLGSTICSEKSTYMSGPSKQMIGKTHAHGRGGCGIYN